MGSQIGVIFGDNDAVFEWGERPFSVDAHIIVRYASQIIRYGQRLGGYVSIDQLDEIEDFPQASKQYFVIANAHPKRMNINRLTLQQLRRHPYINFYMAKAITDYRRLHGDIKSLNELRLSKDFTDEVIQRLEPYIEYW